MMSFIRKKKNKFFNRKKVKLFDDESYCRFCNGTGLQKNKFTCSKCPGTGKFDWIEKITETKSILLNNDIIDYITISTPVNTTDFGDLTNNVYIK